MYAGPAPDVNMAENCACHLLYNFTIISTVEIELKYELEHAKECKSVDKICEVL